MTDGLTENHKRYILTTYEYVDKILSEIEGILRATKSNSPFETYISDATPVQSRVIDNYVSRIREVMVRFLHNQDIAVNAPQISSIWASRTSLVQAEVAIDELDPRHLRGYGELSLQASQELKETAFELQNLFKQMSNYLSQHLEMDPLARLKRLEKLTDEIQLLQELGRIIQLHGLIELRSTLALLVERAESVTFEIAVFGRVSSGKSSLLNHILKTNALPVGITPVTAVPIHISYGEKPMATIDFAESKPIKVELAVLSEFATEQQNPGNHKYVTKINIDLPQEHLKKGVKFVDTPGLGSLATFGAAETLAYLPRCDLGIVLIDAASTITQEDLNTLRLLVESGAHAMVLLSKTDLLQPEDRDGMVNYIKEQILKNMRLDIPVLPVSILDSGLVDNWFQSQLLPLFDRQHELAGISLRRKIGALSELVQSILRNRLEKGIKQPSSEQLQKRKQALQLIKEGSDLIDETKRKCEALTWEVKSYPDPVLKETAIQIARAWVKHKTRQIKIDETLSEILLKLVSGLNESILKHLSETRARLNGTLEELAVFCTTKSDINELPEYANLPVFADSPKDSRLCFDWPLFSFLGHKLRYRHIFNTLKKSGIQAKLGDILDLYHNQLKNWIQNSLEELRKDFEAKSDYYQAEIVSFNNLPSGVITEEQIASDINILSSWHSDSKNPKS
jgi:GTP-binding protein EngB required for normal cell division